ncbi:MAG: adventurous gliding motility lipoprotein CglC [Myxococcaceae bacterium]|nr:adventurous gliding motility lipoprotein CglC [Myxococcaceae bacterium]
MRRSAVIFLPCVAFAACETTDLNTTCTLVKRNPDGGAAIPILKSDSIIKNSANKDFISFGTTQCEDKVCVRDSAFTEVDDGGVAEGYCSRPCVENSSVGCPSFSGALDQSVRTRLSCRPLILDESALAAIKSKDPESYKRIFGQTTSPYFCARSSVAPDAGL